MPPTDIATFLVILIMCMGSGVTQGVPLPLWKSLLIHHSSWGGYMEDDIGRFMCSLRVLSTQTDSGGSSFIEITSPHFSIEMTVFSNDDRIVVFKELTTWKKEAHFEGHSNLEFTGEMVWDGAFYMYVGNVSSMEEEHFATVSLLPRGQGQSHDRGKKKDSSKVGLYVGIPIALALMVLSAAALVMVWAVRKGYLRYVPWSYRAFFNPKKSKGESDIDMSKDQDRLPTPTGGDTAMHM